MAGVSRRGFLTTSGLVVAGVGVTGAGVAVAEGHRQAGGRQDCDDPAVETYGTASLTAAIVGATVYEGHAYVATRGQTPPVVGELDLATHELTRTAKLGRGDGAWAMAAAQGKVFAGTYSYPDLYGFDVATGAVELIETIGPDGGMVWCLTATPNGKIYAGTYPLGEVWGYDPGNGELWNWGQAVEDETYVRTIAADDEFVYAGTLTSARIIRYSRVDGSKLDITPGDYGGIAALLATGGRVYASIGKHVVDFAPDGTDVRATEVPEDERQVDAITMAADGTLYCVGRPTGIVYRRTADALEPITAPMPDDEHRGVFALDERTLLGAAGSGWVWWLDLGSGEAETLDLIEAGLSGPELVQSIAYGPDGLVHAAGNSSITTHRIATGETSRVRVAGEPKQLRVVDGQLYAAMYPSTELLSLDPGTGEVTSYGQIGTEQMRPLDMTYDAESDLVLVGTAPSYGLLKGALTVLDRADHSLTVYQDVVPDQSVAGVAVEGGIAYLGGDTWGGGSVDPVAPSASIVAFDLASREVLWEVVPFADHDSLQHLAIADGVLYGVYKRPSGTWFAMDVATQEVLYSGQLSSYGEVTAHEGQVYASVFGGNVYRLGPDLSEAELMLSDLGEGWFNPPQLAFEPTGWFAWSLSDRELARLRLDPSCPT